MIRLFISLIRYVAIVAISLILSSILSPISGKIYTYFFGYGTGLADINLTGLGAFHLTVDLSLGFLLVLLGDKGRYWVTGFLIISMLIAAILISDQYIYYHFALVLVGGLIGFILRFITSRTVGRMRSLEPLKKYF